MLARGCICPRIVPEKSIEFAASGHDIALIGDVVPIKDACRGASGDVHRDCLWDPGADQIPDARRLAVAVVARDLCRAAAAPVSCRLTVNQEV